MAEPDTRQWQSLSEEIANAAEYAGRSVVMINAGSRHAASGVLLDRSTVITSDHNIRREEELSVMPSPGETIEAALAGRDPATDLAILRLAHETGAPPAELGGDTGLRIGSLVLALARTRRANLIASSGIVSGLMGPWRTGRGGELDQFIRPALDFQDGFSGGPLVDASCRIVGINSWALRRGSLVTIPAATLRRVAQELVEKGHVAQPYLGLAMQTVPLPEVFRGPEDADGSGGLLVMHVQPGGPGEAGGLLLGDVVVEVAGQRAADTDDVQNILQKSKIGDGITLQVIRGGERKTLTVLLGQRPAAR